MGTFLGLSQVIFCTANGHIMTMLHKVLDALLKRKQTWDVPFTKAILFTEKELCKSPSS
jgi:hypothetical protein